MQIIRCSIALGLCILLGGLSCGDDDDPTVDRGVPATDSLTDSLTDASLPPPPPAPFPAAFVVITAPTGRASLTTDLQEITVGGIGAGEITKLEYTITGESGPSSSGAIDLLERWLFTAQLNPGDNVVMVTATDAETHEMQDSLIVTVNPGLSMGRPAVTPEAVINSAATPILFSVKIEDTSNLVAGTVKVVTVDPAGQPTGPVLTDLADEGLNGDAMAGDGIYSALATVDDSADQSYQLRVTADTSGAGGPRTAYSEIFTVAVISPLSTEEVEALEATSALAADRYKEYSQTMDREAAAARVAEDLKAHAEVADAGVSPTGYTIWWEMQSGAPVAFSFYPPGTKGSCSDPPRPAPHIPQSNAMLLEPFQLEFGAEAEINRVESILQGAICPSYEPIEKRPNSQATLAEFRKMDNYGVVVISSHGTVWRNEVTIMSEDKIKPSHLTDPASPYLADFRATPPRLTWDNHEVAGVTAKYWTLLPEFVYHHNTGFPENAIVHSATCSGAQNSTMAAAFLAGGAEVYSGFTNTVSNVYGLNIIVEYFQALVNGKNVKGAWEHARRMAGNHDPSYPSTQFVYTPSGSGTISLISPCHGYTRIIDSRDYVFGGDANSREVAETVYFSSDKVIKSPYDPRGHVFLLESVHRTCRFKFEKFSTLPGGGLTRESEGTGEQAETYLAGPDNPFDFDPDARYAIMKLVIDREAGSVQIYPVPQGACASRDDWVLHTNTSYAFSTPESFTEMGGCSFWGGIASYPGFNSLSDSILVTAPHVEITDAFVKGSLPIENDAGTATLEFYYELVPKQ